MKPPPVAIDAPDFMPSRRKLLGAGLALLPALAGCSTLIPLAADDPDVPAELARIEQETQGRIGLAMLDTGTGHRVGYRADERFPMCSTVKLLLVAQVLMRVDRDEEDLDRTIAYGRADLLQWAPITREQVQRGHMTIEALCEAAMEYSDNTAANLLLSSVGGPEGLTGFMRSIGDPVSRLDRNEPDMNYVGPGDLRDTTTPEAMLGNLGRLLFSDLLSEDSRELLCDWLLSNTTGDRRLRAGTPMSWNVGDKTGSGDHGSTNDVAILLPPHHRAPLLVTAYLTDCQAPMRARNEVLASIGRMVSAFV